jgi:hypothetical protein
MTTDVKYIPINLIGKYTKHAKMVQTQEVVGKTLYKKVGDAYIKCGVVNHSNDHYKHHSPVRILVITTLENTLDMVYIGGDRKRNLGIYFVSI